MNGLQEKDVFLSIAFQPSSDDLRRAARRPTAAPIFSRKSQPLPVVIDIDIDSESSSDEDLPDISTILKNHAAAKGKAQVKGKGRMVDSDSDVSMDDVRRI